MSAGRPAESERLIELSALDRLPEIAWTSGKDGRRLRFNAEWARFTGAATDLTSDEVLQHVHPADRERTRAAWFESVKSGRSYLIENRMRRHDGAYHWFAERAIALRDGTGEVSGFVGVSTDIHNERQGRERLEFLLSVTVLFGSSNDAHSAIASLLELIVPRFADACAIDLFGEDRTFEEVFVAGDDEHKAELSALREISVDSAPIHVRSGARLPMIAGDETVGVLTLVRPAVGAQDEVEDRPFYLEIASRAAEIIVRARAQRDLIASEMRYRVLAEALPHAVAITRPDGTVAYLNREFTSFTGLSTEAGLDAGWNAFVHPDERAELAGSWLDAMRSGNAFTGQYRMRRHDGVYRWVMIRAIPLRDEHGAVLSWIGTATDIDERKRSEDAVALIAEATSVLISTFDARQTLQLLADIVVRDLADWCAVYVYDGQRQLQHGAVAHRDPASVAFAREFVRRFPMSTDSRMARVAESGESVLVERITRSQLDKEVPDEDLRRLVGMLDLQSSILVSLGTDQERLGLMMLFTNGAKRSFD